LHSRRFPWAQAVTCCELGLFALELISDVAVAFPARSWLAPSLSYWSIHLCRKLPPRFCGQFALYATPRQR
tara:strand:- start:79 stop:291 length:213 start_codon:yes stop_codon:yes gene_type:complete